MDLNYHKLELQNTSASYKRQPGGSHVVILADGTLAYVLRSEFFWAVRQDNPDVLIRYLEVTTLLEDPHPENLIALARSIAKAHQAEARYCYAELYKGEEKDIIKLTRQG